MKYRDRTTGTVYAGLKAAVDYHCGQRPNCNGCPLFRDTKKLCYRWRDPATEIEILKLLNLEPMMNDPVQHDGMSNEQFTELVEELRSKSMDTLLKKNANYANADRLHNFRLGAALIGGTPAQAALGYMAKHMASLIDKVQNDDFSDRDDLLEKCQDIINYVCFIWCCGNEEGHKS